VRLRRFQVLAPLAPPLPLAPLFLDVVAAEMSYPVDLTGEGAELGAGLLFLASALLAAELRPRTALIWLVAPLVAGALVSTVLSRIVFGSDEEGVRTATAELELLRDDIVTTATSRLRRRTIHKRLYTANLDGFLDLAGGSFLEGAGTPAKPRSAQQRSDRRGYFLDPWHNPYWVFFDRRKQAGSVYSFGPNRRRDVNIRKRDSDPGDDVIVRFEMPESGDDD
jgi:hypothetical protein